MQIVYTPPEVADLLGLDLDLVNEMAETGRLSGFRLDDEWRISHVALLADLRRMKEARGRPEPLPLAALEEELPPLDQAFHDQDIAPEASEEPHETFRVSIEIENDTSYTGGFHLRLLAEGDNDTWKNFEGIECNLHDAEVTVQGHLVPGEVRSLFNGTLLARVGDRLFITVPEQDGIDAPAEKVYVLHADTDIKLLLTQRGFFSKRNTLHFQRL